MNKKILMTTLGLGLALTLTACGPKNEKADNTNAKNNAAVEANANKNANKKAADAQTKEETAINKGAVAN